MSSLHFGRIVGTPRVDAKDNLLHATAVTPLHPETRYTATVRGGILDVFIQTPSDAFGGAAAPLADTGRLGRLLGGFWFSDRPRVSLMGLDRQAKANRKAIWAEIEKDVLELKKHCEELPRLQRPIGRLYEDEFDTYEGRYEIGPYGPHRYM
jgi:hypothetical protein